MKKNTKHLRDVNSKALKELLGKLKLDKKAPFEESIGHLEYVCMILRIWLNPTFICLYFPSIHHLCHLCDFVDKDIKMHPTVLSTPQIEFFIVSYIYGTKNLIVLRKELIFSLEHLPV